MYLCNFITIADLLVTPINEVAKRCKISAQDAKAIYDVLLKECKPPALPTLITLNLPLDEVLSTGDAYLDHALGGGIRTGMVWEIVGESAAGKSQLALQLSLFVQNPPELGGIHGAACYLTTSSKLPTSRLSQMLQSNENLSKDSCDLAHVHTIRVNTTPMLTNVLMNLLPNFIQQQQTTSHPVKLLVIDALAELFRSTEKMSKTTLFDRSKELNQLALDLHALATRHNIAVVVLNEVIDRFERGRLSSKAGELVYSDQSRFFGTSSSVPGENTKEASLGLVWANAVNARIMMSRTGRRRYLDENEIHQKRTRMQSSDGALASSSAPSTSSTGQSDEQSTLIRRLSIVFSSVSPPSSMDYIVTHKGVVVLPDDPSQDCTAILECRFANDVDGSETQIKNAVAPAEVPHTLTTQSQPLENPEEDEYDRLLEASEDDILYDAYDAFEQQLTQAT
ncbi:Rad51B protein [Coprinopsis cinerea okayama7|uniref:Rad51B protein n=1 Tax=Coprinopsis cinerea (strain Okayama-7 / 130 / ATCC MYA-4618 / FGSC 9003) TaxID=240176 RepID=A8NGU9_COPC7|nr:Rad51B protein [Coprinopsis cinerea okayama7\|eukprot:XP_001833605.2 Rad51B protein [Coprinopsis cinerea okayama7\